MSTRIVVWDDFIKPEILFGLSECNVEIIKSPTAKSNSEKEIFQTNIKVFYSTKYPTELINELIQRGCEVETCTEIVSITVKRYYLDPSKYPNLNKEMIEYEFTLNDTKHMKFAKFKGPFDVIKKITVPMFNDRIILKFKPKDYEIKL